MAYIIAHDLGTSGNKATLFDIEGNLVKSYTHPYETKWFNEVWAEQNCNDWLEAVVESTKQVTLGIRSEEVLAISFSGQMMGCVCVDVTGKALHPAIIWADQRASLEESEILDAIDMKTFYNITGHRPSASYSLAKLMWLRNNKPEVYENTHKVLNAKDYVIYHLTGEFVTDYSDASGTNMLDINNLSWSKTILEKLAIDPEKLPDLHYSTDIVGGLQEEVGRVLGLKSGTPVVCGGGDGSMSALGALSILDGDSFCTIGTSAWNGVTTSNPIFDEKMINFNWVHVVPNKYIPCGTMQAAGASIAWMRDNMAEILEESDEAIIYNKMNQLVDKADPGSNGVYFLPYLLGERSPRWDKNARGCFIGLSMEDTYAHMVRSVYEGVAYNMSVILQEMAHTLNDKPMIVTGGGAKSEQLISILSDMYNRVLHIPNNTESATAIGAAVTAGVGIGLYKSFDVISDFIQISQKVTPNKSNVAVYKEGLAVFEGLYQSLKDDFSNMS